MAKTAMQKPFLSIKEACNVTGLSQCYLRSGCKDGTVPHVMSGCKYLVNVPALLRMLGAESPGQDEKAGG